MKTPGILPFFLLFSFINTSFLLGQEDKKKIREFGIEEGVGYNTASGSMIGNRRAFWIQPTARIYYSFALHSFSESKKIKMPIFIGYYTFGGAIRNPVSIPEDPISRAIILFRSIEGGINPCFDFNKIQIGLQLKGQYIFSVKDRTYGDPIWRNGHSVEETDVSKGYKTFAMNAGLKLKYKIKKLSIGAEAWYGLTNLYVRYNNGKLIENNYRILLGYEL